MASVLGSGKTFLNGATGEGGGSLVGYERRRVGDFQNLPRWATVVCSVRHRLRCYTDVCVRVLLPYIYSIQSSVFCCAAQCFQPSLGSVVINLRFCFSVRH